MDQLIDELIRVEPLIYKEITTVGPLRSIRCSIPTNYQLFQIPEHPNLQLEIDRHAQLKREHYETKCFPIYFKLDEMLDELDAAMDTPTNKIYEENMRKLIELDERYTTGDIFEDLNL